MKKNIGKANMMTRINQSIKLDYLDEQMDKIVSGIDNHYSNNKHFKAIEKISYKQDTSKKRKWVFPFTCFLSFVFGACATTTIYYLLIESNVIRKKKITLDYEIEKNENDPNDTGKIHIKPTIY